MCAGAVVLSRVDRLVFGAFDPKAGAVGSLWDVVRDRRLNHRPEVIGGVLAEESTALLQEFFATHALSGRSTYTPLRRPRLSARASGRREPDAPPVPSSAVACPSGLRSTPRKRVRVHALRGFKSHRHRHTPPARDAWLTRAPGMAEPGLHRMTNPGGFPRVL